ncbi:MAG: hypothetical protein JWM74_807 [Myxococcaceae bacterium]|nr:hypothetical protein [Myxococcaceae bacterium]
MIGITITALVLTLLSIYESLRGGAPELVTIVAIGLTSLTLACGLATWLLRQEEQQHPPIPRTR